MVRKGSPVQVRLRAPSQLMGARRVGGTPSNPVGYNTRFAVSLRERSGRPDSRPHPQGVRDALDTDRLHSTLRRGPRGLALLALAAGMLAALVIPSAASAARPLTTGFQSDYYL